MTEPATKDDLRQLAADLHAEMATKGDLGQLAADLRAEMAVMRTELLHAFDKHAYQIGTIVAERVAAEVRVLDDKYKDLPSETAALRHDLDDHRTNLRIHVRPPPPRSARKSRR